MKTRILLATFIITAAYDVLLGMWSRGDLDAPGFVERADWFKSLRTYFLLQDPASAAIIAGITGLVTNSILLRFLPFPKWNASADERVTFLVATYGASVLSGAVIRHTRIFPLLADTMYARLTPSQAMHADGASGVIVNGTLMLFSGLF